ncbi:hypothetical protein SLS62_007515 [Diatrype stigma]|uniref:Uncharacterized protein n=1 Tax=Diatrype stigma TaxID=117547 RepID=A0AAN9UWK2_9PEZI
MPTDAGHEPTGRGASAGGRIVKEDPSINPNALHDFHQAKRGPKGTPCKVTARAAGSSTRAPALSIPKDPGHEYAQTQHIPFDFFDQRASNAPFGYEHYVSLPPAYNEPNSAAETTWPLILFLHGAGESQRQRGESFVSIRHGIPKVVLCYDRLKAGPSSSNQGFSSSLSIPPAERLRRKSKQAKQGPVRDDQAGDPVPAEACALLAENFITVTPSLDMRYGYGWSAPILSALLDEIVEQYRVDLDRIHVTGFSMGGYGTWDLAMHTPHRFASIMPVCGGGDPLRASHVKHIPHWSDLTLSRARP